MIDLHAHLLPALDDGAPDVRAAVDLAQAMCDVGVEAVAATPHFYPALGWMNDRVAVLEALRAFELALAEAGVPLRVVPGAEHFLDVELFSLVDQGRATPINLGRYLLIELSPLVLPPRLPERLYELRRRGLEPLLAHVERYPALFASPGLLDEVVAQGYALQVDAGALVGALGGAQKRAAWEVVERIPAALVASDAHNVGDVIGVLPKVERRLRRRLGDARAEQLLVAHPAAVLESRPLDAAA